ncbi:MAG: peptidylprolyl isomerase [Methylibium sp. NZG]|nr:MAG: peptidylprolyl isomerase [Methylibium sp. NZG]
MNISAPCVVSLVWQLHDAQGTLIDELKEPVEFFFGGDDLLAKVEETLTDQAAGFTAELHLEPEHAFGDYDPALVFFEERSLLPEPVEAGMQIDGVPPGATTQGMPADAVYTITEVYPTHIVLDGNHPLAGLALRLNMTVKDVRNATDDEIDARSVGEPVFTVMNTAPSGTHLH